MALQYVNLIGTYPAPGSTSRPQTQLPALSGTVQFVLSSPLSDTVDHLSPRAQPVTATLQNGSFSVWLLATDNANLVPAGWQWTITESIGQLPSNSWSFSLPYVNGATQYLDELTPIAPPTDTPAEWDLVTAAGSDQPWVFGLTIPGTNSPWPISGATWEYVVQPSPTSTGEPLISITTTLSGDGLITVTSTGEVSSVALDIAPAATLGLGPGLYSQALWMNPGLSTALVIAAGSLTIDPVAQPS